MSPPAYRFAWAAAIKAMEIDGTMVSEQTFKLTLLSLAEHANAAGKCWPSAKRMADQTGLGVSTIRRAVRGLELQGLVHREMSRGRVTRYFLPLVDNENTTRSEYTSTPSEYTPTRTEHKVYSPASNRSIIESVNEPANESPADLAVVKQFVAQARKATKRF